ncbi:MAG: DUF1801 domain-containing protein [Ignavibacteriaceae bacterium]|nr:DUF1801 domain-containing protein [Ignavibacteriaceae bacterium]
MRSEENTVAGYLKSLPEDRKKAITAVRKVILKNLPTGFEEAMNYGMLSYQVPLSVYPYTYNKQPLMYAGLTSQKNYMAVHLMGIYLDGDFRAKFESAYKATGKKLDVGKGCVRFKKLEDLPLELIGEVISWITLEKYKNYFENRRKE